MNHLCSIAAASLAGVLLISAPACSSDKADDAKETTTTAPAVDDQGSASSDESTTTAPTVDDQSSASSDESTTSVAEGEGSEGTEEGTGTVTLRLGEGQATADKTITFTYYGGFEPAELEVGVGEMFTFKAGDENVHFVNFDGSGGALVIRGPVTETFSIDAPGTYTFTEDRSGETMTVTVS